MNLSQNVCHHEKKIDLKEGHVGSKTRSLDQILENRVLTSRHSFDPVCMKLFQKVCNYEISDQFETGSCRIEK